LTLTDARLTIYLGFTILSVCGENSSFISCQSSSKRAAVKYCSLEYHTQNDEMEKAANIMLEGQAARPYFEWQPAEAAKCRF
jgi:hypothetical protein